MNDDTRRMIYGTMVAFLLFMLILVWHCLHFGLRFHASPVIRVPVRGIRTPIPYFDPREGSSASPAQDVAEFNNVS